MLPCSHLQMQPHVPFEIEYIRGKRQIAARNMALKGRPSMNSQPQDNTAFWEVAQEVLVGGVSSSFRINPYTGQPMYVSRADGPHIYGIDGRPYVDFFMGHGACPLGHNRPEISAALREVIEGGFFAEFDHPLTVAFARKIVEDVPCAEQVRYVNSGTEGTLLALRLARGYTGRTKVVRIDGHFHGGHDYVLGNNLASRIDGTNPGNRVSKIGPLSAGIPDVIRETLYVIPWQRAEVFAELAKEKGHEIAAILMNPIDYNNGCIGASTEYLQAIREICDEHGIVLIFDEILSGFRTGISCAQGYYGVTPDLCLLGKALSNRRAAGSHRRQETDHAEDHGPGGSCGGRRDFLWQPAGVRRRAGRHAHHGGARLLPDMARARRRVHGLPAGGLRRGRLSGAGAAPGLQLLHLCGYADPILNYHDFGKLNPALAKALFRRCIDKGLYFHTDFTVSARHDEETLARAAATIRSVAREVKAEVL